MHFNVGQVILSGIAAAEEVIRAFDRRAIYLYVLLRADTADHAFHVLRGRHAVARAIDDNARRWARREERKIVVVRRRRHGDEAVDLRAPHQQLQADPGPE